ncbi:MAG: GntR family transcriptional regulator [Firmicutes bacterium]|nr:GntR family transcriptional regulator [Bacillota bacterium]
MWLTVDPRSSTPMYQQIIADVKERIAKDILAPGSRLPSIRELAVDMTINPNTIAKAYQELEREGVIEVVRGKGTFVTEKREGPSPAASAADLRELLTKVLVEAHHKGVAFADVSRELEDLILHWSGSATDE